MTTGRPPSVPVADVVSEVWRSIFCTQQKKYRWTWRWLQLVYSKIQISTYMFQWTSSEILTLSLLGSPWGQRPIKNYLQSMSKKYKMADVTPRRFCVGHFFFSRTDFWREGTGYFRSSGEQIEKSIWNEQNYCVELLALYLGRMII